MKTHLICTALGLLLATVAAAQPPGGPEPAKPERPGRDAWRGGPHPEVRELLEQVMMARLSRKLELSDEETVLLVRRFSQYRERMREMRRERRGLLRALEQKVKTAADDRRIAAALNALRRHDQRMAGLQQEVFNDAANHLTTAQQAKLYVFLNDFEQEVQRLVQEARERFRSGANRPLNRQGRPDARGPAPRGRAETESPRRSPRRGGRRPETAPRGEPAAAPDAPTQ